MPTNCENCGHDISNHVGYVYMGGGQGEEMGCTYVIDAEKGILCDCMETPESIEEKLYAN